jgi:hypothetical protein
LRCPHCNSTGPFESQKEHSIKLTIEKWSADDPLNQFTDMKVVCIECGRLSSIDVRNRLIKPIHPDSGCETFETIMAIARRQKKQNPNEIVPAVIIHRMEQIGFTFQQKEMSVREFLPIVLEQT